MRNEKIFIYFYYLIDDETCGSSSYVCDDSSNISPTVIAIIIVFSIFFFVMCLTCCLHSQQRQRQQRLRAAYINSNTRVVTSPYEQQILRGQVRVVHVRSVYNVEGAPPSRAYPSIYEAPPPSYEVATATVPQIHQSSLSSSPPVIATVQQPV